MKLSAAQRQDKEVFRQIFIDHWDQFKTLRPSYDNEQYGGPVQKMLGCGKESNGYSEYSCPHCGQDVRRACPRIGSRASSGVIYRHATLTVPEQLKEYFYASRHDSHLLSEFMRCGHECLEDVVSTVLRQLVNTIQLKANSLLTGEVSWSHNAPRVERPLLRFAHLC